MSNKPFHKQAWFWILLVVLIFIVAGSLGNDSSDTTGDVISDNPNNNKENTQPLSNENKEECNPNWECTEWSECSSKGQKTRTCADMNHCGITKGKPRESEECVKKYGIGDSISVGYLDVTVNDVETSQKIGEYIMDTFMGEKADGVFYIIDLTIENKAKESKNLYDCFSIVDDQGRSFSYDTNAEIYYEGKETLMIATQLQPGLPKEGIKIFDLPENSKDLKLKIECCGLTPETGYIELE